MAQNVVGVLKDMAARGKTVLVTIHQPSSEVFAMFDRLLLMSEGRVAYLGRADQAKDFLSRLGYPCPPNFNPADHYIHRLAIVPGKEVECRQRAQLVCDTFAESKRGKNIAEVTQKMTQDNDLKPVLMKKRSAYKASWIKQFRATIFIALLLVLIYLKQELTAEGAVNINGAIFLFLTNMTFGNLFAVITFLPRTTHIPTRALQRMYRVDVYYICKVLVDVPTFIVLPMVFITIAYWMIGMYPDVTAFFIAAAIIVLVTNAAVSFGGTVPKYFLWLAYISWFKYGNEALAVNQWRHISHINCTTSVSCPRDGQAVLRQLNFHEDNLNFDIVMLFVLIVAFRVLAFIALAIRARRK
ncbi:Protein white [Hypsibius exemplaris]|uniref:Protein white n=1 Tax=Hypsibius exemplaris TaxID=2072580 RepID=A0A1W0WPI1_HYPEX|nr:Protein white [Hypsibius exemplaris]